MLSYQKASFPGILILNTDTVLSVRVGLIQ